MLPRHVAGLCSVFTMLGLFASPARGQDVNGDGIDDLVGGMPYEDIGVLGVDAGWMFVTYGAPGVGADPCVNGAVGYQQGAFPTPDLSEAGDRFAAALATGDFNADGFDDVVAGVPGEDVGVIVDAGMIIVLYGGPTGLGMGMLASQTWHQNSAGVEDVAEAGDEFGSSLAAGDFNGDGIDDVAIGVEGEDIGVNDAGAVAILYGSTAFGLHPSLALTLDQFWHQDSPAIPDIAEVGDRFGSSLAAGDLNDAGAEDLAIGTASEDVGVLVDAGQVTVIFGEMGAAGLNPAGVPAAMLVTQPPLEVPESGDRFGESMAAADFNGIGGIDLAIGAPGETISGLAGAGAVTVVYGLPVPVLVETWTQNTASVADTAEAHDAFGSSVGGGDFDGNGVADLMIAAVGEDVGTVSNAGAVHVIYGVLGAGIDATPPAGISVDEFWHQNSASVNDTCEADDEFGAGMAGLDLDGNGADDLIAGAPGENIGAISNAGMANIIYGFPGAGGLNPAGALPDETLHQNTPCVPGANETDDRLGRFWWFPPW